MKHPTPKLGHGFIYALASADNPKIPRYIGKTINSMGRRMAGHLSFPKQRPNHPLSIWIISELKNGRKPIYSVMEECEISQMKERETAWIRFFKPLETLTNRSEGDGSLGLKNGPPCLENRLKTISRNKRGLSAESREKISQKLKGHVFQWNVKRRKIVTGNDGSIFESIKSAADNFGMERIRFKKRVKRGMPIHGIIFTIKEKEDSNVSS